MDTLRQWTIIYRFHCHPLSICALFFHFLFLVCNTSQSPPRRTPIAVKRRTSKLSMALTAIASTPTLPWHPAMICCGFKAEPFGAFNSGWRQRADDHTHRLAILLRFWIPWYSMIFHDLSASAHSDIKHCSNKPSCFWSIGRFSLDLCREPYHMVMS